MITQLRPPARGAALLFSGRARIVRFALTGGLAALLQLGLLALFERVGWPAMLANGVAFVLATQANFVLSSAFTWSDRPLDEAGLSGRWLRYHAAVAGSAVLNMAVFAAADRVLPTLVASALGIAAATACNYASGDLLVFRPAAPPPPLAVAAPVPLRPVRRTRPVRRAA
jgi:putative flippase GtrA